MWFCVGTDVYKDDLCQSDSLKQKIKQLKSTVERELFLIKELYEISGIMDSLFSSSVQDSNTDGGNENTVLGSKPCGSLLDGSAASGDGAAVPVENGLS